MGNCVPCTCVSKACGAICSCSRYCGSDETHGVKPITIPRESKSNGVWNQVQGEFKYRKPDYWIETTHEGMPMVTVHYGLLAGKWDYSDVSGACSLEDVRKNMKTAEYMMRQVGVKTENLVVISDPTLQNLHKAIKQLKKALEDGIADTDTTQNTQVNFYWGGHSGTK